MRAVAEGDDHARAVRCWVKNVVIGCGFCPWAKPAEDSQSIRVVTSTATTEEGVLADLLAEARSLSQSVSIEPLPGKATTTLLACPYVPDWADFDSFHVFYSTMLGNGDALVEEFGQKVVAFHPRCEASGRDLEEGDEVVVQGPDEDMFCGVVLEAAVGADEDGMELLAVELHGTLLESRSNEGGDMDLMGMQPFEDGPHAVCVRYSEVVWLLSRSSDRDDGALDLSKPSDCRSLIARSPRPVLHLLRTHDLDRVNDREGVFERNEQTVRQLGTEGVEELLRRCD